MKSLMLKILNSLSTKILSLGHKLYDWKLLINTNFTKEEIGLRYKNFYLKHNRVPLLYEVGVGHDNYCKSVGITRKEENTFLAGINICRERV